MSRMTLRCGIASVALLAAVLAAAHVGNHDHGATAGFWHFVTEPAHALPMLVLAAIVVGGLVTRWRHREQARRRIDES